jgi:hypothetical protein
MQAPAHPVEIVFTKGRAKGRVQIDAICAGHTTRAQGEAYDSGALIAALIGAPARGEMRGRAGLADDGYIFAHANSPPTAFYRKRTADGVYSLCLEANAVELEYARVQGGIVAERSILVRLDRTAGTTQWPDDCADEAAHIAIALAVGRHHAEMQTAALRHAS